jgi:hypothetical protein
MQAFEHSDLERFDKQNTDGQVLQATFIKWLKLEHSLKLIRHEYSRITEGYVPQIRLDTGINWVTEDYWNSDMLYAKFHEDAMDELYEYLDAYTKAQPWIEIGAIGTPCKLIEVVPSPKINTNRRKHLAEHQWSILIKKGDKVLVTRDNSLNTQYICPTLGVALRNAVYLLG